MVPKKTPTMRRNNLPSLTFRRRQLRNDATSAEKLLWLYLKHSQLDGRKFRRQHSYGPYIMDFYCPAERLCIELDGATHDGPDVKIHDERRDEFLRGHHIEVLRFRNEEVYRSVERVLEKIQEKWKTSR